MQELVASMPAAVAYLSGPDLVIRFANDACFQLVGDRELLGRPLSEALPELAEQGAVEILARIMETGKPVDHRTAVGRPRPPSAGADAAHRRLPAL